MTARSPAGGHCAARQLAARRPTCLGSGRVSREAAAVTSAPSWEPSRPAPPPPPVPVPRRSSQPAQRNPEPTHIPAASDGIDLAFAYPAIPPPHIRAAIVALAGSMRLRGSAQGSWAAGGMAAVSTSSIASWSDRYFLLTPRPAGPAAAGGAAVLRTTVCSLKQPWSSPKNFRFRRCRRSNLDQNLPRITNPVSDLTGDQ
jgi:hypothetical protein